MSTTRITKSSAQVSEIRKFADDEDYRPGFMELLPGIPDDSQEEVPQLRVAFTLLPGFTMIAFAGFIDALRLASDVGDRSRPKHARWTLVGKDTHPVTSSCGAAIAHTSTFHDSADYDCIVVVGGIIRDDDYYHPELLNFIRSAAAGNRMIVGLCTGVFALAKAGVLDGHECCVHGYHIQEFQERFPQISTVVNQIFVEDRNRLTCAGGASSIDAAGHLIERYFGKARARKFLPHMLVDELRIASHPQLSYLADFFEVHDERVRIAVFLMQLNISAPTPITVIAKAIGIQQRQLERAFRNQLGVSPSQFYRRMRLDRAKWYLVHTGWTITKVAVECGFADASHLTRSFKDEFGELPSECRYRLGAGSRRPGASRSPVPIS